MAVIEPLKIPGPFAASTRQIQRVEEALEVRAILILMTTRERHRRDAEILALSRDIGTVDTPQPWHYRGCMKKSVPTRIKAPATSTSCQESPMMKIVKTPIRTSGKPRPYAGPAGQGELFSGNE